MSLWWILYFINILWRFYVNSHVHSKKCNTKCNKLFSRLWHIGRGEILYKHIHTFCLSCKHDKTRHTRPTWQAFPSVFLLSLLSFKCKFLWITAQICCTAFFLVKFVLKLQSDPTIEDLENGCYSLKSNTWLCLIIFYHIKICEHFRENSMLCISRFLSFFVYLLWFGVWSEHVDVNVFLPNLFANLLTTRFFFQM